MDPRVTSVMVDCRDAERLAAFWGALLGVGIRHRHGNFVWLERARDGAWSLAFQQIDDPTPGKNRLHLDGHHDDLDALDGRVEALGGRRVDVQDTGGFVWHVYADPEENVFCFGHAQ